MELSPMMGVHDFTHKDDGVVVLLLDSEYEDLSLESDVAAAAGAVLVRASPSAATEEDVISQPALSIASVILVELAPITDRVLEAASSCRAILRYGTGLDNIDQEAARRRGIDVRGVPGYAADSVADHTVALMLSVLRNVPRAAQVVADGGWRSTGSVTQPRSLRGLRLGILGLGAIGRQVAARASGFGMLCVGYDPYVSDEDLVGTGIERTTMDDVLSSSDVVSLHLPLTTDTRHLISADSIHMMRAGSVIINTSRGGLLDEGALLEAIDTGKLLGAGLDVTDPEPPDRYSPLRTHPRIVLTPHVAFWSDQSERELRTRVASHLKEVLQSVGHREESAARQ